MIFDIQRDSALPPLAWCAQVAFADETALLRCGDAVESDGHFCFEGAWNGEFGSFGFHEATVCFGSGLLLSERAVQGVTPSHNIERLFLIYTHEKVWVVSNSFPFLLEQAGLELDPSYIFYGTDLDTMRLGTKRYVKSMPLLGGVRVNVHMCENFALRGDGTVDRTAKPAPEPFESFESYEAFLLATANALLANATDAERRVQYTPVTTISSRYDSTAVSAIAAEAGCSEAVTFVDARRFSDSSDDRGSIVAEHLKLSCTEYPRLGYRDVVGLAGEAEFIVGGGEGQKIHYLAFAPHLTGGRAMFTGCSAGRMWPTETPPYDMTYLEMGDASSSSLIEFRLRLGFLYLPLGMAGFARAKDLIRIGGSEQMKPWSIDSPYNRPVSRRILESRNVPRHTFGQ